MTWCYHEHEPLVQECVSIAQHKEDSAFKDILLRTAHYQVYEAHDTMSSSSIWNIAKGW